MWIVHGRGVLPMGTHCSVQGCRHRTAGHWKAIRRSFKSKLDGRATEAARSIIRRRTPSPRNGWTRQVPKDPGRFGSKWSSASAKVECKGPRPPASLNAPQLRPLPPRGPATFVDRGSGRLCGPTPFEEHSAAAPLPAGTGHPLGTDNWRESSRTCRQGGAVTVTNNFIRLGLCLSAFGLPLR